MTRRKGIYSWENEPAAERRSGYSSTVASDWQQSANSTFAEPSRLENHPVRRRRRRSMKTALMVVVLGVVLTGLALLAALLKLLPK